MTLWFSDICPFFSISLRLVFTGCVFTTPDVSLNIPEGVLFTDFVKRLKLMGVFTGKIIFHSSNLRRSRARINQFE